MGTRNPGRGPRRPSQKMRLHMTAAYGAVVPQALHDAIEVERERLSVADSLLRCLALALEHGHDVENPPYYPDVVTVARDMVRLSINGLDSLALQEAIRRVEDGFGDEIPLSAGYAARLAPALPSVPTQQ